MVDTCSSAGRGSFTFSYVALDRLYPGHDLCQVGEVGARTRAGLKDKSLVGN